MDAITSQRGYIRAKKDRELAEKRLAEFRRLRDAELDALQSQLEGKRGGYQIAEQVFLREIEGASVAMAAWEERKRIATGGDEAAHA